MPTRNSKPARGRARKLAARKKAPGRRMGAATKLKQRQFLKAFAELGNVSLAAKAAKVNRRTHYKWVKGDEGYAAAFDDAVDEAVDSLEAEARRRAVEGVTEPVGWFQGIAGGEVQRYSDVLLMFLLKANRPEKYRELHEHRLSGPSGGPIEATIVDDLSKLSTKQLKERHAATLERIAKLTSEKH